MVGITLLAITPVTLQAQNQQASHKNKTTPWREEPDDPKSAVLTRISDAKDRAIGRINVNRLDHRTHNFGDMGTTAEGWHTSRFRRADGSELDSWGWNQSMALAVGPGPWFSRAQVHESTGDYQPLSLADWEAQDGARGTQFSRNQMWYPRFAHSNSPGTWPPQGWPAPEDIEDVWLGTETWKKWKRCADQEAYCEFDDSHADRNPYSSVLDISVRKRILGFTDFDAVFFQFELTNNSSYDYSPVFLGSFGDLGSPIYGSFTGFPRYDPSRQMHYNIGANYDSSRGLHRDDKGGICSWFGFMWLESPTGSFKKDQFGYLVDNPDKIRSRLALTHWDDMVEYDDEMLYSALTADVQYLDVGRSMNIWKTDSSMNNPILIQDEEDWMAVYDPVNADHYYYSSSGPFTFRSGESIDFVVCVVAGDSESALRETADIALKYYQAKFRASGPPPAPPLTCQGIQAGPDGKEFNPDLHNYRIHYSDSGRVALAWNGQESESTRDRFTGDLDFEGYKIYKSTDHGLTWGEEITDSRGRWKGYVPVAQFDLINSIEGEDPVSGTWLGENSGLVHEWTDFDVLDGFEYWYMITAYDFAPPDSSYESSLGGDPNSHNIVAVIPGVKPAGWLDGRFETGIGPGNRIDLSGPAKDYETSISVAIIDQSAITGNSYSVTVVDSGRYGGTYYNYLGGLRIRNTTDNHTLIAAAIPNSRTYGDDLVPVTEGFRVTTSQPNGGDGGVFSFTQTVDITPDTTYTPAFFEAYMEGEGSSSNRANRTGFMNTLEYRFTGFITARGDTNRAYDIYSGLVLCPYELWDLEDNVRLMPMIYEFYGTGQWVSDDYSVTTTMPYYASGSSGPLTDVDEIHPDAAYWDYVPSDPASRSDWVYRWAFTEYDGAELDPSNALWEVGDVWILQPFRVLKGYAGSSYSFSTIAPTLVDTLIDYDDIRVVPNPYYVRAEWDQRENRRMIMFTNVPAECTVDIYTISGEFVASLDHSGSALDEIGSKGYNSDRIGTVVWNIWTYEFTEAVFGLYIYVVKVDGQVKKIGKLAVIR